MAGRADFGGKVGPESSLATEFKPHARTLKIGAPKNSLAPSTASCPQEALALTTGDGANGLGTKSGVADLGTT
jgi:hypothetical protein